MVKRCVRIYIEGGAQGKTEDSDFRRAWKRFLNELHDISTKNGYHSLEVVRGKSRGNAYERFVTHKASHPDDLCVLLVDSETEVPTGKSVWDIVANREGDKWERPQWATDRHLYLMVHFVETWLVADPEALQKYFKSGFNASKLPTTELERRSKSSIEEALKIATKDTKKGPYRHGQAHEILELVLPSRVRTLYHCSRLFDTLGRLIKGEPDP